MQAPMILLSESVCATLATEAQQSIDGNETGGILLGHDHGDQILVTTAGDPGPSALRTSTEFNRDLTHAQILADVAYDIDGSIWVGEWHTHPSGPPTPSSVDLLTYRDLLRDDRLNFQRLLTLIVTSCAECGWQHPHIQAYIVEVPSQDADVVMIAPCRTERMPDDG